MGRSQPRPKIPHFDLFWKVLRPRLAPQDRNVHSSFADRCQRGLRGWPLWLRCKRDPTHYLDLSRKPESSSSHQIFRNCGRFSADAKNPFQLFRRFRRWFINRVDNNWEPTKPIFRSIFGLFLVRFGPYFVYVLFIFGLLYSTFVSILVHVLFNIRPFLISFWSILLYYSSFCGPFLVHFWSTFNPLLFHYFPSLFHYFSILALFESIFLSPFEVHTVYECPLKMAMPIFW